MRISDWSSDVCSSDLAKGRLYFTANRNTPIEQQLYAIDIARPNQLTQLTENGWTNGASMDGAASRIVVSRSKTDHPAQAYLADAAGKPIAWLAENDIDPGHPHPPYIPATGRAPGRENGC